jgi:hypothetical protein
MIYFIKHSGIPVIKVGKADDVKKRISGLQTANPFKLELLHQCEGDEAAEREIHKYLKPARVRGEWFHMDHPRVKEALEFISTGRTAQQFLCKIWLDDYNARVKAIEEHNRKVTLINLINRFRILTNKSLPQNTQVANA